MLKEITKLFNKNNEGPPNLDEILSNFLNKLSGKNNKKSAFNPNNSNDNNKNNFNLSQSFNSLFVKKFLLFIIVIILIIWALLGFTVIDQQEKGVVLRFGKFTNIIEPGLRWRPFLIDKVYPVNVTRLRNMRSSGQMLTEDENIIQVTVNIQYNINNPRNFILNVYQPIVSLSHAFESAVRHVVGSSKMNKILTDGRAIAATEVSVRLQSYLDRYKIGINIVAANIENTQAPSELQVAFDDVIKAREDNQKFQNQAIAYANEIVPIARGMAKRMLEDAQAYKNKVVSEAQGNTKRFNSLLSEYVKEPEVTRKRIYLETLERILAKANKVLIDLNNSNNIMYLPLEQILAKHPNVQYIPQNQMNSQAKQSTESKSTNRNSILTN